MWIYGCGRLAPPQANGVLNGTVITAGHESGWHIEISLTQPVALIRDRKSITLAATLPPENFGDGAAQDLARFVHRTVAGQMDMFIRLAVNRIRRSAPEVPAGQIEEQGGRGGRR